MLKAYVADIRRQAAAAAGRDPRKIFIYNLTTVIVDETDAKAQAKFKDYQSYASYDGSLVFMSGWSGIDFGQYAPTDLIKKVETNAIVSMVEHFAGGDKTWTIEELRCGAALAAWARSSSVRQRRSPIFCRIGSKRPTSTGSTSLMR
jgi:alkanesulfonate monooxygenase SsuD/methylene tetrahydromethanopterin reductase-like flavin-dependent oxidoreductase (luciferase family)